MSRKKKWSVKYTEHRHQNETTSILRISDKKNTTLYNTFIRCGCLEEDKAEYSSAV